MEEFDLGKEHTTYVPFRLQDWLLKDLSDFMAAQQIDNRTQALHDYVSFLKNRIEQQKKEIADLKRVQRSYPMEREPAPAPGPQPVSTAKFHCPHYAKQGIEPSISEETCKRVQENRPDLCRAVLCKKFSAPGPQPVSGNIHCNYYSQEITEEQCTAIQQSQPNICRAAACSRFKSAEKSVESEENRPKGLM